MRDVVSKRVVGEGLTDKVTSQGDRKGQERTGWIFQIRAFQAHSENSYIGPCARAV